MRFLLDTHTFLWALINPERLSRTAAARIGDSENTILVSAVCAWEIADKVRRGKLPDAEEVDRNFINILDRAGYVALPIPIDQALRAGRLPGAHRDPFDRMLAAQALALDIPVLSINPKLDSFGVRRIW